MTKLTALASSDLVPGIDYVVKDEGGDDWVPLENIAATASLRHAWILRRRRRPRAPHFKGCPLPKHKPGSAEQNAKITMTYFHPWTLREAALSDEHVPTLQELKQGWEVLATFLYDDIELCIYVIGLYDIRYIDVMLRGYIHILIY